MGNHVTEVPMSRIADGEDKSIRSLRGLAEGRVGGHRRSGRRVWADGFGRSKSMRYLNMAILNPLAG